MNKNVQLPSLEQRILLHTILDNLNFRHTCIYVKMRNVLSLFFAREDQTVLFQNL